MLRLQARVCAQEMISDLGKLRTARGQFAAEPELHPLDRVLRRCMSTLGGALLGWLLPRESRGAIASAGVQPRVEEA